MPIDIEKIQKRLSEIDNFGIKKQQKSGKTWRPKDSHKIRIVPREVQFIEHMFHYGVDPGGPVICLSMFNKPCPICELRIKLYKSGDDADRVLAKELKSQWRFATPIVVRGEEKNGAMWWSFSRKVYEDIIRFCKNPEYGDISDPIKGVDLDVVVVKPKKEGEYSKTELAPRRTSTPLASTEQEIREIVNSIPDISQDYKVLSYEEIVKIVDEWVKVKDTNPVTPSTSSATEEISDAATDENVDKVFEELKKTINKP